MSSICFSSAALLRCDQLSTNQSIALVIPLILQAILISSFAALLWGRSRHQLFLACEVWIDLLLSLLHLFWELYPAVRGNLNVFRSIDIVIGSMSFITILFYSLYLCSLILSDYITILPPYIRRVVRPFLIFVIPVLIGMNEAASFIGISYTLSTTDQPTITFQTNQDKDLWTFFTSFTLALFAAFQVIVSCLAIIKVVQTLIQRRQLEYRYGEHPPNLRGLVWINTGIQFGAIETIIGFAAVACFETFLSRRIIRLFSRVFLCIGLFIRVDRDDSSTERPMVIPYRQSRPRFFISNPRFSTFQRLSPSATAVHQKPLAPPILVTSDPDVGSTTDSAPGQERVKVLFDQGVPQLEIRLSHFDLPYPPQPAAAAFPESHVRPYSPLSPLSDYVPKPFARPFGCQTDSIASSLSRVEIVTMPRMLFVPELAKATVMRTPSGRTVERPVSPRPPSRPRSQCSDSSPRELLSLEETKGKRIMSREQNEEFFEMLMSAGVRSFNGYQAGEVEENMNMLSVPSTNSITSFALSSSDDATTQEDHQPSMEESYYAGSQDVYQSSSLSASRGSCRSRPPMRDSNRTRASAAPQRPPRNPSRASNFRQSSPDPSSHLVPNAVIEELGKPRQFRKQEELWLDQRGMSKTPSLALHAPRPYSTTEPVSPARADSDSAYSSEVYERQIWGSQTSIDTDQIAIAL